MGFQKVSSLCFLPDREWLRLMFTPCTLDSKSSLFVSSLTKSFLCDCWLAFDPFPSVWKPSLNARISCSANLPFSLGQLCPYLYEASFSVFLSPFSALLSLNFHNSSVIWVLGKEAGPTMYDAQQLTATTHARVIMPASSPATCKNRRHPRAVSTVPAFSGPYKGLGKHT